MVHLDPASGWKLSRDINLPFVAMVVGQLIYGTWIASQYDAAIQNIDSRLMKLEAAFKEREVTRLAALERLTRLEAEKTEQTRRLDRIEQKIDRILEGRQGTP